jgi:peptide subunit release factor 1 (eRF1)
MTEPTSTPLAEIDLRPLAEMEAAERAFLSCYLTGETGTESLKNRITRVRRLLAKTPAEMEHFEASLALLEKWLADNPPGDGTVAVFACGALDFVQGWRLPVAVPNTLRVGAAPYLRPLAELKDEYGTLAVIAADNRAATINLATIDRTTTGGRVRGDVKNAVKKGGWSQKRYARRRDKQLERYATDVVSRLEELDKEHTIDRIVLVGSSESLQEIEGAIPEHMRDRVFRRNGVSASADEDDVMEAAWAAWFAAEREGEQKLWDQIREEAFGQDMAAMGATEVLAALQQGRVDTVLVSRDSTVKGTQCRACSHLVHGTPDTCQQCGSADVFTVDLVNEFVRLAELTAAYVEFADASDELTEEDGVVALLRY